MPGPPGVPPAPAAAGPSAGARSSGPAPAGAGRAAGGPGTGETDQAAAILRAAGWRVACLDVTTPLAVAWQQLGLSAIPLRGAAV